MHFLLTNDDGIDAPGLAALRAAVEGLKLQRPLEATIVAPLEHQSGCGHQTTTHRPLRAKRIDERRFAVDGSPADCVRLGLLHLAERIDWVLSGINDGGNLGVDVFMSGTVAGAREAVLLGRPAVAISHYRRRQQPIDWAWATRQATRVLSTLLAPQQATLAPATVPDGAPMQGGFWNVNLPAIDSERDPEIVFCELDTNPLHVAYELIDDGYHFRGAYQNRRASPGSDVESCFAGNITVTHASL